MTSAPTLATLDPRTVSRAVMLERLRRPDLSVVLFGGQRWRALAADPARQAPTLQVVLGAGSGHTAAASARAITMTAIPGEPFAAFVNRTVSAALGEIVLLAFGSHEIDDAMIAAVLARFAEAPHLGALALEFPGLPATDDCADLLRRSRDGIAIRGDLWSALSGFEGGYGSLDWYLCDLFTRVRAIGFDAPRGEPQQASGDAADRLQHRLRAERAPDRSQSPAGGPGSLPDASEMAVFTSITNGYDSLKPQPARFLGGAGLVAFLDAPTAALHAGRTRGWRVASRGFPVDEPRRASRFLKANSHLALPDKSISLWIDASISVTSPVPLARLASLFLADADICVFRHHARRSIEEEALACKRIALDRHEVIDAQLDRYRREGLPETAGLAELPVLLRRHSPAVCALNEAWWAEILSGSHRDQLSFNYVAWKLGVRYATFPLTLAERNGLFLKFQRPAAGSGRR